MHVWNIWTQSYNTAIHSLYKSTYLYHKFIGVGASKVRSCFTDYVPVKCGGGVRSEVVCAVRRVILFLRYEPRKHSCDTSAVISNALIRNIDQGEVGNLPHTLASGVLPRGYTHRPITSIQYQGSHDSHVTN